MHCVARFIPAVFALIALAALAPSGEAQAFQTIVVSPGSFNFGAVQVGGREFYSVNVQNVGDEDIQFLSVYPYGDSSQFYISNFCGYLPRYGTCSLQIQFAPSRAGHFSLDLSFNGGTASGSSYMLGEGI